MSNMGSRVQNTSGLESPVSGPESHTSRDELVGAVTQEVTDSREVKRRKPWIRYRTELRHRETGELLYRNDSDIRKDHEDDASGEMPVLEHITRYTTNTSESKPNAQSSSWLGQASASAPSSSVRLYSQSIIHALLSVVEYYPGQNLVGTPIEVHWPYAILVHHYDQLLDFKVKCEGKEPTEMCVREKDAPEHIDLLIRFLDEHIMERVNAEHERLKRGFGTFEDMWVSYKPGRTVGYSRGDGNWCFYVISEVTGGIQTIPPSEWKIRGWTLVYDGHCIGRCEHNMVFPRYNGELDTGNCFVDDWDVDDLNNFPAGPVQQAARYGEMWYRLLTKQCQRHEGKSLEFPYNQVEGLVMTDLQNFYTGVNVARRPKRLGDDDVKGSSSNCTCTVCQKRSTEGPRKLGSIFDDYLNNTPRDDLYLTPHMYLLCPPSMHAYVFKFRKWELLHVKNFHEPKFDGSIIDTLVMDAARIKVLKALASSYIRVNQRGKRMEHDPWAADFIQGKGSGLIFLLHGKPGVGKTVTAESIAEYCQRPLMVLTSADVGTNSTVLEHKLTERFNTAKSWGAVLLIDEADVFMERRGTADLERNSLVAAFLRALESYDGLLFLTTNRVGAFDDAFISRIHVQLFYPDFTDDERQKVWMTFVAKLTKERGKYIRVTMDAKDYIRGAEIKAIKWNGREIRNAFQTAVSLAEYEDERDEEGKILLTDDNLRAVVGLSTDFKKYLNELHKADEDKRALRRFERLEPEI